MFYESVRLNNQDYSLMLKIQVLKITTLKNDIFERYNHITYNNIFSHTVLLYNREVNS